METVSVAISICFTIKIIFLVDWNVSIDYRYRCTTWQCTPLTVTILRKYHFIKYSNIFIIMCWMSKPDLEIQHLTSKTVFQTEDFWENILIESHKVWWDNKSIKGIILVRLLVDYLSVACSPPSLPPPVVKTRHLTHPAQSSELSDSLLSSGK